MSLLFHINQYLATLKKVIGIEVEHEVVKIQLTNGTIVPLKANHDDLTSKIEKHSVKQLRKFDFHLKIMSPLC